jgi:hypothetical protein
MIVGYDHGYWVEWPRSCFGDVIRPHVTAGVAHGWSPDQTWRRILSIYRITDDSRLEAREIFDRELHALREAGRPRPARAAAELPAGSQRAAAADSPTREPRAL